MLSPQHRSKHTTLIAAAHHMQYQVPDKHTQVYYIITNLEHQAPDINAYIYNDNYARGP